MDLVQSYKQYGTYIGNEDFLQKFLTLRHYTFLKKEGEEGLKRSIFHALVSLQTFIFALVPIQSSLL